MAPFIGAVLALTMFSEPVTTRLIIAAVLMGIGLWLHLVERHDHDHVHDSLDHAHAHVHAAHHQHTHGQDDPPGERSEEHTSELQSLMRISYAVFCLKQHTRTTITANHTHAPHTI